MLQLDNVSKTYRRNGREVCALADFSFRIDPGQFVAVRGPSGCGKSTLLLTAGGLMRPDAGIVSVDEQDLYKLSAEQRAEFRARYVGFVFQQFHLVPYLNILDNVLVASLGLGHSAGEVRDRAMNLIESFGLADRLSHVPAELSVGERQRTALARALLNQPRLLLADEPTGNLDTDNARTVLERMKQFAEAGGAVLLVTHDAEAARFAQQVIEMDAGQIRQNVTTGGTA